MTLKLPEPGSRQRQVLDLVCIGKSNKQIAAQLGISPRTVEVHRSHALRKIGARTGYEAIQLIHAAQVAALKSEITQLVEFIADCLPAPMQCHLTAPIVANGQPAQGQG